VKRTGDGIEGKHRTWNKLIRVGKGESMRPGDLLKTAKPIRSQKTGVLLPREGTFVRMVENMGRQLILVNFGAAGHEYIFPEEISAEPAKS
jgi:hypothetical protein